MATDLTHVLRRNSTDAEQRQLVTRAALESLGWPASSIRSLHGRVGSASLLQLATGGEPRVLFVYSEGPLRSWNPVGLGYSREAPYTVWWQRDRLRLNQSTRWSRVPGDAPLIEVEGRDPVSVRQVLQLVSPDALSRNAPAKLAISGRLRETLHERLADALSELRIAVAESALADDRPIESMDSSLLRLFHQLLFIRFQEDRGRAQSPHHLEELLSADQPQELLSRVLARYSERLNSDFFAQPDIPLEGISPPALRAVVTSLVEPWAELRLNFSITQSEIAGRLYQSYLERTPAAELTTQAPRLFPRASSIDSREKSASYYTPISVARELAYQTLQPWLDRNQPKRARDVRVLDPACGSGAFLIAAYRILRDYFEAQAGPLSSEGREELLRSSIFGADADPRALGLAQVQLLEEADLARRPLPELNTNLFLGDSLGAPPGCAARGNEVDWSGIVEHRGQFDVVLANPPFGAQVTLPRRLTTADRNLVREHFPEVRSWGSDYAYLFLALATRLAGDDGAIGFVMPRTFLVGVSGKKARQMLSKRSVNRIVDCRGLRLFPDVASYVTLISSGPGRLEVVNVNDSRQDVGRILEDVRQPAGGASLIWRTRVRRSELSRQAESGWSAFRLRWTTDLTNDLGVEAVPFSSRAASHNQYVLQGTQPGALKRFVIDQGTWEAHDRRIQIGELTLPEQNVPLLCRADQITPFRIINRGMRLFLPFTPTGDLSGDPQVRAYLRKIGGLPDNPQPGNLKALAAPKVLIRSFGRELAAAADLTGGWITVKGTAGAIAISRGESAQWQLEGWTALLNSSLYQWLLRGLGRPRADETVELASGDVADLPWPMLTEDVWRTLKGLGSKVATTLDHEDPHERIATYYSARSELDEFAMEALSVAPRLRRAVANELLRPA